MGDLNVKTIAALATAGLALLIVIVSMATDYWVDAEVLGVSSHTGLWRTCGEAGGIKICNSLLSDLYILADWFKAVQAAACLGFVTNLAAAVALGLFAFIESLPAKLLQMSAVVLLGIALFWSVIAVAVFGAEQKSNLGWSWGLMIGAAILQLIAIGLSLVSSRDK